MESRVGRPRRTLTVVVAVLLSTLMVWTPHARAQEDPSKVYLTASEAKRLAQLDRWISQTLDAKIRTAYTMEKYAARLASQGTKPTVRAVTEGYKAARASGTTTAGMAVGTLTAVKGAAAMAANGVVGFLTPATAAGAGAVATGIAVGYGAVKLGVWSFAPCDHWITTGSPDCAEDPVPPFMSDPTVGAEYGYEFFTKMGDTWTTYEYLHACTTDGGETGHYWYIWHNSDGTIQGPYSYRSSANSMCGVELQQSRISDGSGNRTRQGFGIRPYSSSSNVQGWESQDVNGDGLMDYQWWGVAPDGYYAEEHESEAVADRTVTTRATCLDPATGSTVDVSATSDPYAPGDEPLSPAVNCPTGYPIVSAATVTRHVDGQPELDEVVADYVAPDDLTTPDASDPLSDCRTSGSCELMVYKGPIDAANRCDLEDVVCLGWWQQMVEGATDVYTCGWGGNSVPWTDCEPLANIDNPEAPQPGEDGEAGVPVTPGDLPGSEDNPVHVEDGCGFGWGDALNPLRGLSKGVACALEWAFVPTTTSLNTSVIEPLEASWNASPPGAITSSLGTFFGSIVWDRPTGCTGMLLDLTPDSLRSDGYNPAGGYPDLGTGFSTRIGIPCEPPFDWSIPYGVMLASVALAGILGAYNQVAKAVGAPTDGSSIEFRETGW